MTMRMIGILLIIVGVIGVVWGGVTYIKDRDTTHIGPVDIVVESKDRISISPVVGVAALVVGGLLVGVSSRRNPKSST
jgi:drug/metabolite transporter (DMT)-like permease